MGKGLAATLICLLAFTVIGEEPLPPVQAKTDLSIDLPVEPQHDVSVFTLAEAATRNDFGTFEFLYNREPDAAYADLHELWTYAQTERLGAFYGAAMHDRLARRYPGFAAYIDEYRIVDQRGQVFYPTSETRTFLLKQAMSGSRPHAAPIQVAKIQAKPIVKPQRRAGSPTRPGADLRVLPTLKAAKPLPVVAAPPKPVAVAVPAPVAVAQAPVVAAPKPVPTPVPTPLPTPAPAPPPATARPADNAVTARGILLMILGLLGIGVLTMMLRTPAGDEGEAEGEPEEPQQPSVPTLKLTKLPPPDEAPRKTGSHG